MLTERERPSKLFACSSIDICFTVSSTVSCSLCICRAKSPGERLGKRNQSSPLESSESGGMHQAGDSLNQEQLGHEDETFRNRLNDIVSRERDRLLGIPTAASLDELW